MSRYRKVDPRIWNDEKFRALSNKGKLIFFMLLTHPAVTALGAMRGSVAGLADEMGWPLEAFRDAFNDILNQDMVEIDSKACLIALPNFVRYNRPESPNVVKAWIGSLDMLPECELLERVVQRAEEAVQDMEMSFQKAFAEAFGKPMPYQEQEQEQEQKKKKHPPTPRHAGGVVTPGFELFWVTWPTHHRKVAKAQCAAKWEAKGCEAVVDAVIAAVVAAKASDPWSKNLGEFIPAPLVWLNQARWEAPAAPTEAQAAQAREDAAKPPVTVASDAAEKTRAANEADAAHLAAQDPEEKQRRIAAAREATERLKGQRITA